MSKLKKHSLFVFVLALLLLPAQSVRAANGTITYLGQAEKFVFDPGSRYNPSDLFTDFKNVMPGDTLTDEIELRNGAKNNVRVRVYMRSLGARDGSEDFLSQLKLAVELLSPETKLFEAPADKPGQLTDWVCLGTLSPGGKARLEIRLDVPLTLDSKYQNSIGYLDWEFMIEELPDPGPLPRTGVDWWPVPVFLGISAAFALSARRARRRKAK